MIHRNTSPKEHLGNFKGHEMYLSRERFTAKEWKVESGDLETYGNSKEEAIDLLRRLIERQERKD